MSEFFASEIVREELDEINKMQETVYGNMMAFSDLSREEQIEHVELLIELLQKQKVMYTRLSLSDDPMAKKMKANLQDSVQLMGFPKGTDINMLFEGMRQTIENLRQQVDSQ